MYSNYCAIIYVKLDERMMFLNNHVPKLHQSVATQVSGSASKAPQCNGLHYLCRNCKREKPYCKVLNTSRYKVHLRCKKQLQILRVQGRKSVPVYRNRQLMLLAVHKD